MKLIGHLLFAEAVTTVTGSIALLLWRIFRCGFQKSEAKAAFPKINWVLALYTVPVCYILLWIKDVGSPTMEKKIYFWLERGFERKDVQGVWLFLMLAVLAWDVWRAIRVYRLYWGNVPEDKEEVLRLFERLKSELGIQGSVTLEQNDLIRAPRTAGFIRKRVILPYRDAPYDEKKLKILLSHELMHLKSHDDWYRVLLGALTILQCFNPVVYLLPRVVENFCEYRCDIRVLLLMQGEFSEKEYFDTMVSYAGARGWEAEWGKMRDSDMKK